MVVSTKEEKEDIVQKKVLIAVGIIGEEESEEEEHTLKYPTIGDDHPKSDVLVAESSIYNEPVFDEEAASGGSGPKLAMMGKPKMKEADSQPGAFPVEGLSLRRGNTDVEVSEAPDCSVVDAEDEDCSVVDLNLIEAELVTETRVSLRAQELMEEKPYAVAEVAPISRRLEIKKVILVAGALVAFLLMTVVLVVVLVKKMQANNTTIANDSISYTQSLQVGNTIIGPAPFDRFGDPLKLSSDGTIIAVGARNNADSGRDSGIVRVFRRTNVAYSIPDQYGAELFVEVDATTETDTTKNADVVWTQLGNAIQGEAPGDEFAFSGMALSSSGTRVAIGAVRANFTNGDGDPPIQTGNIRIFDLTNNPSPSWTQVGPSIYGIHDGDWFGRTVAISGEGNIVAGNSYEFVENGENIGHVRVFRQEDVQDSSSSWVQLGNTLSGKAAFDRFGRSLDMSSNGLRLAVGATQWAGIGPGYAQVFDFNGTYWNQVGQDLVGVDEQSIFGRSVALSPNGSIFACGGSLADVGENEDVGMVRIYQLVNSETWQQLGQTIWGADANDRFGESVALSNNGFRIAIGAGQKQKGVGYVQIFDYDTVKDQWNQVGQNLVGDEINDQFGFNVGMSSNGHTLAVGAVLSNANGNDSGHVQIFDVENI